MDIFLFLLLTFLLGLALGYKAGKKERKSLSVDLYKDSE